MKGLSLNVHDNNFRRIRGTYNSIIKNNLEKNDPESERSFKVINVESKKYTKDNNLH